MQQIQGKIHSSVTSNIESKYLGTDEFAIDESRSSGQKNSIFEVKKPDIEVSTVIYLKQYREIEMLKQGLYRYGLHDSRVRFFPDNDGVALQYTDNQCNRSVLKEGFRVMKKYMREYTIEIYDLKTKRFETLKWPTKVPKKKTRKPAQSED